ncbi:MAG TPA: HAMP domain-containing sensor histidine kinase [Leifsonia sp.]|nr:HAMP domain-containing sensor histidine kinase [Leifsonia sp.]
MRWLQRLSITARITIGSLIVATLFGLGAVEVVRLGVASILHNATVTLLNNDVSAPAEALKNSPSGPFDLPGGGQELAIIGPDGAVLDTTLPSALNDRGFRLLQLGDDPSTVQAGQENYLVLVRDVPTSAGTMHVVAARNTETTDLILDRLTVALLGGAGVLVVGFGGASWLLARTALRPVSRMRKRAESIAGVSSTGLLPVGPAHDELAALATTLNDLIRRLRASADRERQMVSDASHELRTPLAVLRGQLELAELDAGDADALLTAIRSSHTTALRLGQLASNLLELSRIEAGPRVGRTDWRTLTEELADAIDRARLIASPRSDEPDAPDISIDFDYRPRERQTAAALVALSPTDFGRILDNLLGNAITALTGPDVRPDAERTIAAELIATPTEVTLTVCDSGPGMAPEFLPVAMDRFTRAEVSRTGHSGGGLGLSIVSALAGSAGGSVDLANAGGGGLVVTVVLPRVGPPRAAAPTVSL